MTTQELEPRLVKNSVTEKPMEIFNRTFGEIFEKMSRSQKLFLIQMIAAELYATEPEKVSQEILSCVLFANQTLSIKEQEKLLLRLIAGLFSN